MTPSRSPRRFRPPRSAAWRCGPSWSSPSRSVTSPDEARAAVDAVYRGDSRRVLATLIRLLGDFDLAEEAMHEAFSVALERWPRDGLPGNPRAWLVSRGGFKAIDRIRRRARFAASLGPIAEQLDASTVDPANWDD